MRRALLRVRGGRLIKQATASRFDPEAEFAPKEVILLQGVFILGPVPAEQLDELLVGKHVPILPNDGDVDPSELIARQTGLRGQPHGITVSSAAF